MKVFTCIFILQFLIVSQGSACIWRKTENPHWPSTNIQVCFNQRQSTNSKVREAKRIIRNAFVDLSRATRFNFRGFTQCNLTPPLRPAIRVSINSNIGVGSAASIGPSSSRMRNNLARRMVSSSNRR